MDVKVPLENSSAEGHVIEFGAVNLVLAKTEKGTVGCGLIDVAVFEKFNFPAAKAKAKDGPIKNIHDLLDADIVEVNRPAEALGVRTGMTGRQALEQM